MRDEEQDNAPVEGERSVNGLIRNVIEKEKELWQCLHSDLRRTDPVTTYHLEQIASHLHSLLFYLKPQRGVLVEDALGQASLGSLLESLGSLLDQLEVPRKLSVWKRWWERLARKRSAGTLPGASAWELAGEFERQLIELGDDTYLYTLLKDQRGSAEDPRSGPKRVPTIANWQDYFPDSDLTSVCKDYEKNGKSSVTTKLAVRSEMPCDTSIWHASKNTAATVPNCVFGRGTCCA
jgi:hypothetical protein